MSGAAARPAIVLLHEIYGVNGHIKDTAAGLEARGFAVYCPDLLGKVYGYDEEAAAYEHYMRVGFKTAAGEVAALAASLADRHDSIFLIGYSAGATTAWLASGRGLFAGVVGYYGSRIRDCLDVSPACPVLLFFPSREETFSVPDLTKVLAARERVTVNTLPGRHGFADRHSPRYDAAAAAEADALAAALMQEIMSR